MRDSGFRPTEERLLTYHDIGIGREIHPVAFRRQTVEGVVESAHDGETTLIAWARELGRNDCAEVLEKTLVEEGATDQMLTNLAESRINLKSAA